MSASFALDRSADFFIPVQAGATVSHSATRSRVFPVVYPRGLASSRMTAGLTWNTVGPKCRQRVELSLASLALSAACPSLGGQRRIDDIGHDSVIPLLILLPERLCVQLSVRIEPFFLALLPRDLEFGRCNVPVRPTLLCYGPQILAQFFHSRTAEKPVAVVDLINNETWFKDDRVGNHRIVARVRVFGDVEVFLHRTSWVR